MTRRIQEVKIEHSGQFNGTVHMQRVSAGIRNQCQQEAWADGDLNVCKYNDLLLPHCIAEHPWGTKPIKDVLYQLDVDDYDNLMRAMFQVMKGWTEEQKKKSDESSNPKEKESTTSGQETDSRNGLPTSGSASAQTSSKSATKT